MQLTRSFKKSSLHHFELTTPFYLITPFRTWGLIMRLVIAFSDDEFWWFAGRFFNTFDGNVHPLSIATIRHFDTINSITPDRVRKLRISHLIASFQIPLQLDVRQPLQTAWAAVKPQHKLCCSNKCFKLQFKHFKVIMFWYRSQVCTRFTTETPFFYVNSSSISRDSYMHLVTCFNWIVKAAFNLF